MPEISVARRYAQAMIDVAAEADAVERIGDDLKRFVTLLDAHDGQLRAAMCTPVFTVEERSAVLDALLPRLDAHPLAASFLRLANDKRRLPIIDDIAATYASLANARAGRVSVTVSTAEPMSPQIELAVKDAMARVTGKEVLLDSSVDASLIGGMVARVGGKVYDSSIRTRLEGIKVALLRSQTPGIA